MSSGIRELRVWQESVALAGDVIRALRQSVRRETKNLIDSVMATAVAVGAHIADGYAAHTPTDQRESYQAARQALLRLETELAIARHADLIPAAPFADLTTRSSQVARLLTGYLIYLDREISDQNPKKGASPGSPVTLGSVRAPS